jgi:lysyl-tRNA synthetase, class II
MSRLQDTKDQRIEKLEKLKKLGVNPFAHRFDKKHLISQSRELLGDSTQTAGRVMSVRGHGALVFMDLVDETGKIQLILRKDNLDGKDNPDSKASKVVSLTDIGDFVGVSGKVVESKSKELSIDVESFSLLTKSIRPLPSQWHGLKDNEERYRQRYLDILLNKDLKLTFKRKAIFWQSFRQFLLNKGFLEVETPVLENTAGGADANPFVTHHNALDIDLYLRISMGELWQKRLMVSGFEKTFEIGRQFRNEGLSPEHLQDYTQMEFYWGYANYKDSMKLTEEMYKYVAQETFGTLKFDIGKHKVDLGKTWQEIDYADTVLKKTGADITKLSTTKLKEKLNDLKIKYDTKSNKGRLMDYLWKHVRKDIAGPVFLTGHPVEVSPLAKRKEDNPNFVERFQIIIAGSEIGNGYSELNDPIDQEERFEEQQEAREAGDTEAQMHDRDFVRALEYGMPPVSGFGVSERLFSFLANKSIRETVLFPLLRPEATGKK